MNSVVHLLEGVASEEKAATVTDTVQAIDENAVTRSLLSSLY